jgi:hypothetical protein
MACRRRERAPELAPVKHLQRIQVGETSDLLAWAPVKPLAVTEARATRRRTVQRAVCSRPRSVGARAHVLAPRRHRVGNALVRLFSVVCAGAWAALPARPELSARREGVGGSSGVRRQPLRADGVRAGS